MENIAPKDNPYLVGHEEEEKFIFNAWKEKSLHQSLLISGPEGIGKATFAFKVARFLLQADEKKANDYKNLDVSSDAKVFRQISSLSHPDFKLVERNYIKTDRQKIYKAIQSGNYMSDEELSELKKSAEIVVDDIREVNDFLSKSSADGNWRVVIIDSADEMNRASANAILKILEEPPSKTLMLLISHNPSGLLPTIRSRCAKIELKPLNDVVTASLLRRYRSELSEDEIKKIIPMVKGSIGKAIAYADNQAVNLYEQIKAVIASGKNFSVKQIMQFCDIASSENNYGLFKELLSKFLLQQACSGQKVEQTGSVFAKALQIFRDTESLNLDKRQAVINIMVNLARME